MANKYKYCCNSEAAEKYIMDEYSLNLIEHPIRTKLLLEGVVSNLGYAAANAVLVFAMVNILIKNEHSHG